LVARAPQVAHDASDVARDARHPLGPEHDEGDDEDEEKLAGPDAEHQLAIAAARAAFAASRSANAAAAARRPGSPPPGAHRTDRDAEGITPSPPRSMAARTAVSMSPPCAPTPGSRKTRSGAIARSRRVSSGYVAPTTKPVVSRGNRSTTFSTTRS